MTFRGYMMCEKCWNIIKLKEGDSPDDFDKCEFCGGQLKYTHERGQSDFFIRLLNRITRPKKESKKIICPNCGTKNLNYAKYCEKCGYK
ncbi:MAG: zinc ribbon domain-containing protein [Methanobacterium sp.]|nr:zinc ribbon domain-containing protein [Methanobacterium sp.]